MTEAEPAKALENAGWKSGCTYTPSAADAWALYKKRFGLAKGTSASRTMAVGDLAKNVDMPTSTHLEATTPMGHDKFVHIAVDLPTAEALALAQFVKRVTWTEMRACAVDEAERYEIRAAI